MNDPLASLVNRHRNGESVGITSICSANPLVLEATMREAGAGAAGGPLLVEATSSQVNQDGGYTGMRPPDFRDLVHAAARAMEYRRVRLETALRVLAMPGRRRHLLP